MPRRCRLSASERRATPPPMIAMSEGRAGLLEFIAFNSREPGLYASDCERAGLGGGVALAHLAPVHYVPPRLQVVGPAVLVGEVIGVLPHIVAEEGAFAVHQRCVLVGLGLQRQLAVAVGGDEDPAGAEHPSACRV